MVTLTITVLDVEKGRVVLRIEAGAARVYTPALGVGEKAEVLLTDAVVLERLVAPRAADRQGREQDDHPHGDQDDH